MEGHYEFSDKRNGPKRNTTTWINLMQSATVGLAVGIFDAEMWIDLETSSLNGFTYAMGAFFVQGRKLHFQDVFQQGMDEKHALQLWSEATNTLSVWKKRLSVTTGYGIRMQEAQLEAELR